MQVIEDNELGAGGFIPTDKKKLNMEGRDNVFVLGDTTNLQLVRQDQQRILKQKLSVKTLLH